MNSIMKRKKRGFRPASGGFKFVFLLLFSFLVGTVGTQARVLAADVELLTPRPGSTIVAKHPETHFVLRQALTEGKSPVRVEKDGATFAPLVTQEDGGQRYLHFRLPLKTGLNRFTILPSGQRVEIRYRQIQGDPDPRSFDKDVFLFHQHGNLPKNCRDCHDLKETKSLEPVGIKEQTSCAECHQNLIDQGAWKHSTTVNRQCLVCHQQSVKPWRIGFPTSKMQDICLACHTGKRAWFTRKYVHGPVNVGDCTVCHDPHGGSYRYQLWADGSRALCLACHSDMENLVRKKKPLPYVHGIIKGQGCVVCHSPHATDNQFMLRKPVNDLCVGCHTKLAGITRGHPVSGHPLSGPEERRRPGRRLTCVGCHNPHGSKYKHLLVGDERGAHVCIICHR
jgi:predicted CXXCH cytochrome family protein